ncbi:hypothetical protein [Aeromonas veronii]|uniref:hypothetical protein n=1 Tax=Aeromonas veronii TaxID=654 RepID=UPI0024174F79|nr:hypothetical protein [Aeromonas veronii]WFO49757.1 hypothetical protein L1O00_11985 [Aeromonas veronii]
MEEILLNLRNPAWWFTGTFFVILFHILPKLIAFFKNKAIPVFKGRAKKMIRGVRLKQARYIKSNRYNLAAINYQSMKSQSYFVVYALVCLTYFIWYVAGPLIQIKKESDLLFLICILPMIISQVLWMHQNDNAKLLVAEYNKVRIKK